MIQEVPPYLVDHLAAASENKESSPSNVTNLECPAKPSDYQCPQVITSDKEELKKKICEYETVLSGTIVLYPDNEKAQSHCGAFNLNKQYVKCEEDRVDLPEHLAVVIGKGCPPLKPIIESSGTNETVHLLVKTVLQSGTKFILVDGANIDLIDSKQVSPTDIAGFIEQCPKKSNPKSPNTQAPSNPQAPANGQTAPASASAQASAQASVPVPVPVPATAPSATSGSS